MKWSRTLHKNAIFIIMNVMLYAIALNGDTVSKDFAPPPDVKLSLWYRQPAKRWETQALPIGNGSLRGMIFGGVEQEHIQFNEDTVWNGGPDEFGAYQNFGDVYIDFKGHTSKVVRQYRRELDIENAICRVSYKIRKAEYKREYFASYPDNVIVMRFTSSRQKKISIDISIKDAHKGSVTIAGNRIFMAGILSFLDYESQLLVLHE